MYRINADHERGFVVGERTIFVATRTASSFVCPMLYHFIEGWVHPKTPWVSRISRRT